MRFKIDHCILVLVIIFTNLYPAPLIQNYTNEISIPERRLKNLHSSFIPLDSNQRKEISENLYNLPDDLVKLLNEFVGEKHRYQIEDIQLGNPSLRKLERSVIYIDDRLNPHLNLVGIRSLFFKPVYYNYLIHSCYPFLFIAVLIE